MTEPEELFEKWLSARGYSVERSSDGKYLDPLTRAVKEGYIEGCIRTELGMRPMYAFATELLIKHGLRKEFEDGFEEHVKNSSEWQRLKRRERME